MANRPLPPGIIKADIDPFTESLATTWLSAKRGKAQWSGPPTLARLTTRLLPQDERSGGVGIAQLKARWIEIVGDKIGAITQPDLIKGETLVLKVAAAAAPFITMRADEIIGLVRLAGGTKVKKLTLIRAPITKATAKTPTKTKRVMNAQESRALDQKLEKVVDTDLKAALKRLADATLDID